LAISYLKHLVTGGAPSPEPREPEPPPLHALTANISPAAANRPGAAGASSWASGRWPVVSHSSQQPTATPANILSQQQPTAPTSTQQQPIASTGAPAPPDVWPTQQAQRLAGGTALGFWCFNFYHAPQNLAGPPPPARPPPARPPPAPAPHPPSVRGPVAGAGGPVGIAGRTRPTRPLQQMKSAIPDGPRAPDLGSARGQGADLC
jgi:hypothetical protein